MNKIFHKITSIMVLFTLAFGSYTNVDASAISVLQNGYDMQYLLPLPTQSGAGEAVVYEPPQANGIALTNAQVESQFGLIIYAYKQMRSYPGRSGTELIYFDINKINGPTGLSTSGSVCTSTQKTDTSYYSDTVTVGYTFCTILDAIKYGTPLFGIVPTEGLFLHNSSGSRLSKSGSGGAIYLINPADPFIRNYTIQRYLEKIAELGIEGGFSDNLQPGWNKVTAMGTPAEYSSWTSYNNAMAGFACQIYSTLKSAGKEVWGNLTSVDPSIWAQYSACLDGAMAETWIMDWGGFPSATVMETDLSITRAWLDAGKKALLIAQDSTPDSASNQFVYASSLLVGNNVSRTFYKYAHYSGNYSEYFAPPAVNLGNPKGSMYQVSTNVWERSFDTGCVRVDLSAQTSLIAGSPCNTIPTQTSIVTNTPQVATPTPGLAVTASATFTAPPAATFTPTLAATSTPVQFTFTPTALPASPTSTQASPTLTATSISSSPTVEPPASTPTSVGLQGTETIYDDMDSQFVYSSNWGDITKKQAYNGSHKLTTKNGSYVTLAFTGQAFSVIYRGGPAYRKMEVYVDNVLVGTINQKASSASFQLRWDYPGVLTFGDHTLKLVFVTTNTSDGTNGSVDAVIIR